MYSRLFRNLSLFSTSTPQRYTYARDIPTSIPRNHMNLFTAINSAIDICLETDPT